MTTLLAGISRCFACVAVVAALLSRVQAADTVYTVTTTGTQNQTAATYTQTGTDSEHSVPNSTDAGNVLRLTTAAATTLNLDQDLTLGGVRTNINGNLTIGAATGTLTMDATGMTLSTSLGNPFGNAGNAFLAGTNSGGLLTVSAPVVIANTDLDIGNSTGVNTGVTITGNMTASTDQTLSFYGNGSGGLNVSGNIGTSGSDIAIENLGNSTASTMLNGALGTSVTTVTQNSATSSLTLSGTNLYAGGTILNAGTINATNTAATNVLQALGTGLITVNGGTLALSARGTANNQTIISGNGVTGNNVAVGGDTTFNFNRSSGANYRFFPFLCG